MKAKLLMFAAAAAAAVLTGCNKPEQPPAAKEAQATAPKKKVPYCFFKSEETKAWSASTDASGNVVVKGKAYREDGRYKAILSDAEVEGGTATVRPSVTTNDTGHSMADGWWDVSLMIPNSAAVQAVSVRCGDKVLADLPIKRK